jgi:REP element-mobilizing transposase RayT
LNHILLENQAYHTISTTRDRRPVFADPVLANVVLDTIRETRIERAHVLAWAVMPDHLHLVLVPREPYTLPQVMQNIKGNASWAINRITGRRGPIWQQGYYDRMIRSEMHLFEAIAYVNANPVVAGLAKEPGEYPFASYDAEDTDLGRWFRAAEAG